MLSRPDASGRAPESAAELGIFTGRPAFAEPLHVGRPNVVGTEAVIERIRGAMDRRWLTNHGPLVGELEERMAELCGVEHCVAVANATVGIQLVAKALELSGEVIVPSWTFVGTAQALSWVGLEPVFCDIDPATHCLDPAAVAAAVTPRTAAILGVHLWGRPCDVNGLAAIAERHGVPLLFDAAHAIGCTHGGKPIGGLGHAEVFSLHATKVVNAAEGGVITTDDAGLAERLRVMRGFGFTGYDRVAVLGTNAKMSELSGALGVTGLEHLDELVEVNTRNHDAYAEGLAGIDGVTLIRYDEHESHNHHYVVLEVDGPLARDDLVAALHHENVLARRYFHPGCHRLTPYAEQGLTLEATEHVSSRVVTLPTGTALSAADIAVICRLVALAVDGAAEVGPAVRAAGGITR